MKPVRVRKHLHEGFCPECGKLLRFRSRAWLESQYEEHRLAYHPTFFDAMRSVAAAAYRFREAVTA